MRLRYPFWTLLAVAAALCVVYTSVSMRLNGGALTPPLDDAFIHFQYARRMAEGAPFSYQAGDGFSSGATSLLWPAVLAVGWRLGFQDVSLYVWTLILNTVLLAAAGTFTWRWLGRVTDERTALVGTLLVVTSGPLVWAAFSGMEVLLFATAMAAVLDGIIRPDRAPGAPAPGTLAWAAVLATVRPEGAVFAGLLAVTQVAEAYLAGGRRARAATPAFLWFAPAALGAVQPLLNLLNTGIVASSSALAKRNPRFQHPDETVFVEFVWDKAIWGGYGTHFFDRVGYLVLPLFAIGAWTLLLRDRERGAPGVGTLGLAWWGVPLVLLALFLPLTWHHFRYLQPSLVVFVPFLAIGAATVDAGIARLRDRGDTPFVLGTLAACLVFTSFTWPDVLGRDARDIREQQVALGRWIDANVPEGAVVAANDVGALAYLGGRRLLDLEGIVSMKLLPDALEGEGSTYAAMLREDPDLYVVFPTWFDTTFRSGALQIRRYARVTQRSITGGDLMVVARLVEDVAASAARPPALADGERIVDTLDVSDRLAEEAHGAWFDDRQPARGRGNTVVAGSYDDGTRVVDAARRLHEAAGFRVDRGGGSRLVGRFGPSEGPVRLLVRVDGADVGVWDLPTVAEGTWRDAAFDLPGTGPADVTLVPLSAPSGPKGGWHLARVWTVGR